MSLSESTGEPARLSRPCPPRQSGVDVSPPQRCVATEHFFLLDLSRRAQNHQGWTGGLTDTQYPSALLYTRPVAGAARSSWSPDGVCPSAESSSKPDGTSFRTRRTRAAVVASGLEAAGRAHGRAQGLGVRGGQLQFQVDLTADWWLVAALLSSFFKALPSPYSPSATPPLGREHLAMDARRSPGRLRGQAAGRRRAGGFSACRR